MKFYRETEFQETEIGKIPRDWRIAKLKDVAEIRGNKKLTRNIRNVTFIPMEAIPDNKIYTQYEIRDIREAKSFVYCEPGDILLAKITPSFENGKQGIVPLDIPGNFALATTEVYPIKCKDIDTFYLFYLLKFSPNRNKLKSLMRGTTGRRRVPRDALEMLTVPIPPRNEQQKIAEILSTVDRAIENIDNAIARLERLKKALMGELLAGRIRVKDVDGKLTFYRETEFQETEIGKIPTDWRIAKLGEIAESRKEIVYPQQEESSTPYVGLEHIMSGEIRLRRFGNISDVRSAKMKFYKGDILYGKLRPYLDKAVLANIDGVCSTDIIVIKTKKDIIPEFLIYVLHSKKFIKHAISTMRGTNHPRTSWESIARFKIGVPPLQEQRKIAEILSAVDRTIELYINERGKLEKVKNGLMSVLLTGKVRVRDD
ncbi:MAG: restriction endonuclease subunit S [Thermofilum sp.]|nr:restriction endonuclease subunit S [Thermofilum sp.]